MDIHFNDYYIDNNIPSSVTENKHKNKIIKKRKPALLKRRKKIKVGETVVGSFQNERSR